MLVGLSNALVSYDEDYQAWQRLLRGTALSTALRNEWLIIACGSSEAVRAQPSGSVRGNEGRTPEPSRNR